MDDILVIFLGLFGIVYLMCDSLILEGFRTFLLNRSSFLQPFVGDLLSCHFCMGFHVSLMGFLFLEFFDYAPLAMFPFKVMAGAFTCLILGGVTSILTKD